MLLWALMAFAPTGSGRAPSGDRASTLHPAEQARLGASPDWRGFIDGEGHGWTARWDEATRTPSALRGPGIDLGAADTADDVGAAFLRWAEGHRRILGLHADDALRVADVRRWGGGDAWFVDVERSRAGLPIRRGGLTASIRAGRLGLVKNGATGQAEVRGTLLISAAAAIEAARNEGPAPEATHTHASAAAVLVPHRGPDGLWLVPAWEVRSTTADPLGRWHVFVDAQSGRVLAVENDVRMLEGVVSALHHARNPADPLTETPIQEAWVEAGDLQVSTGEDGSFSIETEDSWSVRLHGDWLDVDNAAGQDAQPSTEETSLVLTAVTAHPAEVDTWVHAQHMRDWGLRVDADVGMSTISLDAVVNLPYSCNAWFDGNINFLSAGDGCNNTGMIADVIYHEWGHGFHFWSNPYGLFDGSLSEGASDVIAFLQTGDHVIAPFFYTNGGGIRDVENEQRYPDDYVPSYYYSHYNGLIFGGAMWDLWGILQDDLGAEEGTATIEQILVGILKAGPTIESSFDDAVFADDDNGTLADGTPHLCAIIDAFGAHGLGPGDAGVFLLSGHEPVEWGVADVATPLRVDVLDAGDCINGIADTAWVTWRANGGEWVSTDLLVDGNVVTGAIPSQPDGTFVEYYLTLQERAGAVANAPAGGETMPYTFYVGDVIDVLCEDFEAGDAKWTHELLEGADDLGADDWMWGAPQGIGGDPDAAWSGTSAWGNDLALEEGWDGQYQDGKKNKLVSVDYDTGPYAGVFLRYRRWLSVEDGAFDDAVIRADGDVVWRNWASGETDGGAHHIDTSWIGHVVPLGEYGDDGTLMLSFSLESDDGLHFGGWTLDDVCLHAPATVDNRLAIRDFTAEPDGSVVLLRWTQPSDDRLDEIRVVRRLDTWPVDHNDGALIHTDDKPVAGAAAAVADPGLLGQGYYAVYARSGEVWLSWTKPGYNADDAIGDGVPGVNGTPAGGLAIQGSPCGCDAGRPLAPSPLVLLVLLLRRRRP